MYLGKIKKLGFNSYVAKKPETKFKERIFPLLRKIPYSWVEKIQQVSKHGTPDFLCCFSGIFVAIELKKDLSEMDKEDETSILQNYKLYKISEAKGIALKICPETWEETYLFLKSIKENYHVTKIKKKTIIPRSSGRSR